MSNSTKADLLLLLATFLAAISWMFSKEAVQLMPPLLFVAVRFFLAGVILAVPAWSTLRRLSWDQYRQSIMVGVMFGLAMSCWIMGMFYGNHVGEGAFLTSLAVVLVPVWGRLLHGQKSPRSTWVALPVAVVGLALLSLKNGVHIEGGQLFYVAAAIIFAHYFNMNMRAANERIAVLDDLPVISSEKVPPLALTAVVLMTVGGLVGGLSWIFEPWLPTVQNMSFELFIWVAASIVIGTSMRFLVQTYAQSLSNHSHGVVILVVEPIWTALLAAGWFGETMSWIQVLGCSVIFSALIINKWSAIHAWLFKRADA